MKHEQLKLKAISDLDVKAEYDALEPEFALLREMLSVQEKTGLSQEEIAVRMRTKAPAVTGLSPHCRAANVLHCWRQKKYAKAVDCHVEIKLIQNAPPAS